MIFSGIRFFLLHYASKCAIILGLSEMAARIPGCSADGSALEWGSRGRWFKSSHSDQEKGLILRETKPFSSLFIVFEKSPCFLVSTKSVNKFFLFKMYPRNWTVEVFKIPRTGQPQLFEIVAKSQKLDKQRF